MYTLAAIAEDDENEQQSSVKKRNVLYERRRRQQQRFTTSRTSMLKSHFKGLCLPYQHHQQQCDTIGRSHARIRTTKTHAHSST
mmetsp:Transcript_8754/g.12818  ORF Transcript_8754/g.12818 Transcript_8754/m.12818 type:complete len:84 (-) Transcript_8754:323-574(-)